MRTFFDRVADHLLAPFQSIEIFLTSIAGFITAFTDLRSATGWLYLITSFAIAAVVHTIGRKQGWIDQASLIRFLFPSEIYLQRSARADYMFVAIDMTIRSVLYTPLIAGLSLLVYKALVSLAGGLVLVRSATALIAGSIAVPIIVVLAADFVLFFYHYLMHRIPVLWVFHQVHHSAEVLTPITVYRVHPVEELVYALVGATITGVGAAIYTAGTSTEVTVPTIFGLSVVQFLFFSVAFQLRHSHIWLSYGPVLSRIFISPAQHQVHHSTDPRHWNKNFGFVFAFWDVLFRSLYVPRGRETISVGLLAVDPRDFLTVRKLYFLPFAKATHLIRTRAHDAISPLFVKVKRQLGPGESN